MTTPIPVGELNRQTYIGGSAIIAIMGVSPWQTPLDCYRHYIGETIEAVPRETQRLWLRGKRREPEVISDLIDVHNITVTKRSPPENPNRYQDGEFPFLAAEIDFEWLVTEEAIERFGLDPGLIGTTQNGEVKTLHPFAQQKIGEEGTDEIPIENACQGMFGLDITGRQLCMFVYGVDANDPVVYFIHRDEATIAGIRKKAVDFWYNNVQARVPPEPSNMDDMMYLLAKINGRAVALDDATAVLVQQLKQAREMEKAGKEAGEELKFRIADYIRCQWMLDDVKEAQDDARLIYGTKEIASWKAQSTRTIDVDRLRLKKPDIAEEFTRVTHSRVLRIKKK